MALQPLFRLGNVPSVAQGGFRSLLAFWIGGAAAPAAAVATPQPSVDVGGKRRRGTRRRLYVADEHLTEAEAQYIARKLAELKEAKTAREEAEAVKALEVALAQAVQDEEAAEIVSEKIAEARPNPYDYAGALRDVQLLTDISRALTLLAHEIALERRRIQDEDDVETLLLMT